MEWRKFMVKKISLAIGCLVGLGFLGGATSASAEKNHFSVQPELPTNQLNGNTGYFNLKMKSEQKQTIYIKINNGGKENRTYDINTNLATTSNGGSIDYTNGSSKIDTSLDFNLEKATTNLKQVTVAAKASKRVPIKIEMPDKPFKGIALGGIVINQRLIDDKDSAKNGVAIRNQFAYTIPLQLREQAKQTVKPTMNLLSVGPQKIEDHNYITAQLQNPRAVIMDDLKVTSYLTKAGSDKKLLKTTRKEMRMAPNSNFHFALGDGTKKLAAGKYTMHVKADSEQGKYKWNFKKNFTITPAKAESLTKTVLEADTAETTNWWLIGSLIAAIAALASALFWMIYRNRRAAK